MAKSPSGFQMFLLELALPMILNYGKTSAVTALQKAIDESENNKEMIKLAATSLYPVVDTVLEDTALKSRTKVDDKVVTELKEIIETIAFDNEWELPNLDAGTEND